MRTPRQQFEQALCRLTAHNGTGLNLSWQRALQDEFETAAITLWRVEHPRSRMKFSTLRKRHFDFIRPIFDRFKSRATAIGTRRSVQRTRLHSLLDRLALSPTLFVYRSDTRWRCVWSSSSSSYSTQGFGACKYARNSVENQADIARAAGVPVVIRAQVSTHQRTQYDRYAPDSTTHYEAWCPIYSDTDVELLRRKPGPSLIEQVRLCWKRGTNPRVYNPFLPPNFEAQHGLDCFGGITGKAKTG